MFSRMTSSRQVFRLAALSAIGVAAPTTQAATARSVQLVVQPSESQVAGVTHGLQVIVSRTPATEVRMMTTEPAEDGRLKLFFEFVNKSDQAVNIGPENFSATTLTLIPYDKLMDEQRRREGRKKFGNFLSKLGTAMTLADAGDVKSDFSYSGSTLGGGYFSGSGTITTHDPYLARQEYDRAYADVQTRTEEMYRSFANARSAIGINLRTTTVMPHQQLQGVVTFDAPKSLRSASSPYRQFTITIQMGADHHVLNGFVGAAGTLPPIAPPSIIASSVTGAQTAFVAVADSRTSAGVPTPLPAPSSPPSVAYAPTRPRPAQSVVQPPTPRQSAKGVSTVTIDAYRRGEYAGQPERIAALAKEGFAPAQYELGTLYELGKGVPQNNAEAVRLYRLAAAQGLRDAQGSLAWMYESGLGVAKNVTTAKRYYRLAAEQGDRVASARLVALETGR